jgi:membrane-bound lytic murein transglycosylase MltF
MADVAVLPAGFSSSDEMVPARPCPSWLEREPRPPTRLRLYAWSDSPALVGLLNAAAVRLSAAQQDSDIYAMYCEQGPPQGWARALLPRARQISRYAGVIAKYADAAGLDWRLVAAVIFEESNFEENAVSSAGALGLMQLMPAASVEVGIPNVSGPESNIRAGVRYLQRLAEQFPEARASDRLALVLASYLIGPAHVFDAQGLARDRGLNPQTWHGGLEPVLPLLEDPQIRTRAGFAHGRLAVDYVNRILERYETYRRHLERDPDLRASAAVEDRDDA